MLRMRSAAATMHQRDVLMATAFDGIGSLPMATIDRFRYELTHGRLFCRLQILLRILAFASLLQ